MSDAGQENERFEGVRETLREIAVEERFPSLAVGVAQDGVILWEDAFGWADREKRVPATPHTPYSLASISKPIAATGLMLLAEQAKVDLDRPIDEYLGDAKLKGRAGDADDATVRRVANHTAGLPLHYHFFYADEPYRRPSMDETILRYGHLVSVPGERYQYSNLGYGLLDYVISRLSGRSFAEFMRREVFLPLGMVRSSVGVGPGLEPYAAARYGSDGLPYPYYTFDHPGASEVYCSVHDLLRFGMLHLKTRLPDMKAILSDDAIDEMQRPTSEPGKPDGYGIGWRVDADLHGCRTVSHNGGMGGVSTTLHLLPDEKIAVAVLCNRHHEKVYGLHQEILSALLPDYAERCAVAKAKREAEEKEKKESGDAKPDFQPSDELRGEWEGTVHTHDGDLPFRLTFKACGDVQATLDDQLTSLVNDVEYRDGWLSGGFHGHIGTEDVSRRLHTLRLDLRLRGDALNGAVMAHTWNKSEGGAPGKRVGNGLSHWAELKRVKEK